MAETVEDTFSVGASPRVVVKGEVGDIAVESGPDGTIHVGATLDHPERLDYEVRQEGGAIIVEAGRKREGLSAMPGPSGRADIAATVPRSTDVDLGTVAGDVELRGVESDGKLHTVNGKVTLFDAVGRFNLSSVNGKVSMDNVKGAFRAETVNGAVEFAGEMTPGGENTLKTVNGRIRVRLSDAAAVRVEGSAVLGAFRSELPTRESAEGEAVLFVSAVNGSVTVE